VVNISPLLRELVLQACRFQFLKMRVPWQKHFIEIILDQLKAIQMVPLQLPHLSDPRAIRVTERLITQPGNRLTLTNLCKSAGASKRTLERIIQKEAGMTLGKWRQQLRLMEAVRLLAEGAKVTHAALDAGYNSPSAFISMFRKTLGTTPAVYFRAAGARGSN
jgi:AraC-like DNA-binding protein